MSGIVSSLLSPARVAQALASVGPPAGSGGLRPSAVDPVNSATAGPTSPSRTSATTLTNTNTAGPSSTSASPHAPTTESHPATKTSDAATTPAASASAGAQDGNPALAAVRNRGSNSRSGGSGGGAGGNSSAAQLSRYSSSGLDSPKYGGSQLAGGSGTRMQLVAEASATSGANGHPNPNSNQRYVAAGTVPYTIAAMRTGRGGAGGGAGGRDRDRAGSLANLPYRSSFSSMNGGFFSALDSMNSQMAVGGGGLQPAAGTAGGIDVSRLLAIQRLLDEYDSDENNDTTASTPRGEASSLQDSESMGRKPSDSGSISGSGLRTVATLRSRGDMHNWQPSVTTVKGTLEQHQRRLRERSDVTQSLKRWTEQVMEEAKRTDGSRRMRDVARAASVRFQGVPDLDTDPAPASRLVRSRSRSRSPSPGGTDLENHDPEQELDDDEERRLEAQLAAPPNPNGLGAQLRAHFQAVVEEEVAKKFEAMRARWEEERGLEVEELRELRENYKELRKAHNEAKDALEKANTRVEVMRMQLKACTSLGDKSKAAAMAAAANAAAAGPPPESDPSTKSAGVGGRSRRGTHDGGKGGRTARTSGGDGSVGGSDGPGAGGVMTVDDELHERLRSIGSRRPQSITGGGDGVATATASTEPQTQLKAHADATHTLTRKLQEAEQQVSRLKHDKTLLEQQLTKSGTTGTASAKYDAEVQIFKLKQEKETLQQQLAAAHKAGASMAARNSAKGGGRAGARGTSGKNSGAGGGGAASAKAAALASLAAEAERMERELAAARQEAANNAKTLVERALEIEKLKENLASTQTTLNMALQQITSVKEGATREKERADAATAMAEAAEAAAAMAATATAAANEATTALLKKQLRQQQGEAAGGSGGGGQGEEEGGGGPASEVAALVDRLERERDSALATAGELRQQVRELTRTLGLRQEEVTELRDQLLKRQMDAGAKANEQATAAGQGAPAAAQEAAQAPPPPPPRAPSDKVTAGALAAMRSMGRPPAGVTSSRRRPTSAVVPGAAAGGHDAAGVAAAAAAAALVPAVMEELRKLVPQLVAVIGADCEGAVNGASGGGWPEGAVGADVDAMAAAAGAAAGTAAATTVLEGGDTATAAAAGASAAAPTVAFALADLLRAQFAVAIGETPASSEQLPPLPNAAAGVEAAAAAADVEAVQQQQQLPQAVRHVHILPASRPGSAHGAPRGGAAAVGSGLSPRQQPPPTGGRGYGGVDRLYVFPPRRSGGTASAAAAATALAAAAVGSPRGGASGVAAAAAGPTEGVHVAEDGGDAGVPQFVMVDGVTFVPLGVRDAWRARRPQSPGTHHSLQSHELQAQQESGEARSPHHTRRATLPSHTPFFDAAAAAAAINSPDLAADAVSVPAPRASLLSRSEARRRKAAFAQLHSSYFTPPAPPAPPDGDQAGIVDDDDDDGGSSAASGAADADEYGGLPPAVAAAAATARARALRFAQHQRQLAAAGAVIDAYGNVYVDPDLAAVLHVGRVSPAAARAAGAGRGAVSPEALGPSLRDRALTALQPDPPPQRRPQSAAVRTLEAARLQLLHSGGNSGGAGVRTVLRSWRPVSAVLPPVGREGAPAAEGLAAPGGGASASGAAGGTGGGSWPGPSGGTPPSGTTLLAGTGAKVRTITANPQKGIQLPLRPRGARHSSVRSGLAGGEGVSVRFQDEEPPQLPSVSVTGKHIPGLGLTPPLVEVQLHTGPDAAAGTYLVPAEGDPEGAPLHHAELPSSGPELAALARDLMAAQGRVERELEQAMASRRELADEVVNSRQQWLEEARRARALEKELDSVRAVLVSMGVGAQPEAAAPGGERA